MVAALQKVDSSLADSVDEPVLLGDSSAPGASEQILQGLRLTDTRKRIPQDCLDKFQNP
jgi:hypothetical protein